MITTIVTALALMQPCPLIKHHKDIKPIQSCVLTRPLVVVSPEPAPDPDPVELSVVTRYQVIESTQQCEQLRSYRYMTMAAGPGLLRAPEIDPGNALTSITLLVGCLVVMRSRP